MIHYQEYMGFEVKVKDKEGSIIEGTLISYEHGLDEDPPLDYDLIGIKPKGMNGYYVGIPIPDIVKFTVLDD